MRILGVDPGLIACGYAILDDEHVLLHGTIRAKRTLRSTERHLFILSRIQDLIIACKPDVLAVEEFVWIGPQAGGNPVVGRDAMCKLVGGIFAFSLMPPYPTLHELLPQSWGAQLLGGRRSHDKADIAYALNLRLGTNFDGGYHSNHESDAVGIALVALDNINAQQYVTRYSREYTSIRHS